MKLLTISSDGTIIHKNKMFNLYMDQELVDTELVLADGKLKVHGIVLATESKKAYNLLRSQPGPQRTLKWTRYTKEVMRFVLEYIYRGTVTYPKYLDCNVKSLINFLQLSGVGIKKVECDNHSKTKLIGQTPNLLTNFQHDEVIEISDEEILTNCTTINQSPTKSILQESIEELEDKTSELFDSVSQNRNQCELMDDYKDIDIICLEPSKIESEMLVPKSEETEYSTDEYIPIENSNYISIEPYVLNKDVLSHHEFERGVFGKEELLKLQSNDNSSHTNEVVKAVNENIPTKNKIYNFQPEEDNPDDDIFVEKYIPKGEQSRPNNDQVNLEKKTIGKESSSKISILSQYVIKTNCTTQQQNKFLIEDKQNILSPQVLQSVKRKVPEISCDSNSSMSKQQNIAHTRKKRKKSETVNTRRRRSQRISNKHCGLRKPKKNKSKIFKFSPKYCLVCDRIENNIRSHLKNCHKVSRKSKFVCEKCSLSFYHEEFKNIHVCQ